MDPSTIRSETVPYHARLTALDMRFVMMRVDVLASPPGIVLMKFLLLPRKRHRGRTGGRCTRGGYPVRRKTGFV